MILRRWPSLKPQRAQSVPAKLLTPGNLLISAVVVTKQEIHHDALVLLVHVGTGRGDAAELTGFRNEGRDFWLGDDAAAIGRRRKPRGVDRQRVATERKSARS
ncbi:hypothetical protein AYJ54_12755 [Bradyrhizobium centrolobii]|uniref:Uncharacterized protein n=1 Tax=Bradyrhizobium centrolobii TaxID=1505087 RepID=A0A176YQZ8_9BRAD|nr:hypothetical protein AYJ54_12755 [Bradyrhizobium centrolobii]